MSNRKAISKKTRFEVFKRDSFTCQYCGQKAPEVILHVDHIDPVASGGDSAIMNLITSCVSCNLGKGARKLNDNSAIEKQRAQIEELNTRREQIEMMVAWRNGLKDMTNSLVGSLADRIASDTGFTITANGAHHIRGWLKNSTYDDVLDAWETSYSQYVKYEHDKIVISSVHTAFDYVPRILNTRKKYGKKPYLSDLFYIRGILRNRIYVAEWEVMSLLEKAHLAGYEIHDLKDFARNVRNWTMFRSEMIQFIESNKE